MSGRLPVPTSCLLASPPAAWSVLRCPCRCSIKETCAFFTLPTLGMLPAPPTHLGSLAGVKDPGDNTLTPRGQSWFCVIRQRGQESQWAWQVPL